MSPEAQQKGNIDGRLYVTFYGLVLEPVCGPGFKERSFVAHFGALLVSLGRNSRALVSTWSDTHDFQSSFMLPIDGVVALAN